MTIGEEFLKVLITCFCELAIIVLLKENVLEYFESNFEHHVWINYSCLIVHLFVHACFCRRFVVVVVAHCCLLMVFLIASITLASQISEYNFIYSTSLKNNIFF